MLNDLLKIAPEALETENKELAKISFEVDSSGEVKIEALAPEVYFEDGSRALYELADSMLGKLFQRALEVMPERPDTIRVIELAEPEEVCSGDLTGICKEYKGPPIVWPIWLHKEFNFNYL